MEKVKIFTQGTTNEFNDLEDKINAWLAKNKNIKILSSQITSSTVINALGKGIINCTIMVFYRTKSQGEGER